MSIDLIILLSHSLSVFVCVDFLATAMFTQSSNVENLSPQIIRQVVREMHDIHTNAPEGIKVQINESDVTDIQAVLEGPG